MALSGDDRLLESMQEFRRADHIFGKMTTSSESTKQHTKTRDQIAQGYLQGFTESTKSTKQQEKTKLLFMEEK